MQFAQQISHRSTCCIMRCLTVWLCSFEGFESFTSLWVLPEHTLKRRNHLNFQTIGISAKFWEEIPNVWGQMFFYVNIFSMPNLRPAMTLARSVCRVSNTHPKPSELSSAGWVISKPSWNSGQFAIMMSCLPPLKIMCPKANCLRSNGVWFTSQHAHWPNSMYNLDLVWKIFKLRVIN